MSLCLNAFLKTNYKRLQKYTMDRNERVKRNDLQDNTISDIILTELIVVGKWSLALFRIIKTSMEAEYHRHEVHCGHRSTSHTYK